MVSGVQWQLVEIDLLKGIDAGKLIVSSQLTVVLKVQVKLDVTLGIRLDAVNRSDLNQEFPVIAAVLRGWGIALVIARLTYIQVALVLNNRIALVGYSWVVLVKAALLHKVDVVAQLLKQSVELSATRWGAALGFRQLS